MGLLSTRSGLPKHRHKKSPCDRSNDGGQQSAFVWWFVRPSQAPFVKMHVENEQRHAGLADICAQTVPHSGFRRILSYFGGLCEIHSNLLRPDCRQIMTTTGKWRLVPSVSARFLVDYRLSLVCDRPVTVRVWSPVLLLRAHLK